MNHFIVNGVERPSPVDAKENLRKLIDFIHQEMVNETQLVSSVRVDGKEIGLTEEEQMSGLPLNDIDTVEITFIHPRELAEDTLQSLKPFAMTLAEMSLNIGDRLWAGEDTDPEFRKLLDGIETFIESLNSSKTILKIHSANSPGRTSVLEADLLSLMRDMVHAFEMNNLPHRVELLTEHLPANLKEWSESGVNSIIRSRDS